MPGWKMKGFAAYGLILGLAVLNAGLQLACHKSNKPDDFTDPPSLSYASVLILPTAGQPFTSVAPEVSAYYVDNGVGSTETEGPRAESRDRDHRRDAGGGERPGPLHHLREQCPP
jgi:hypothetical protein